PLVLSVGGKTELDGAAAEMVAQVAVMAGLRATTLAPMAVRPESLGQLDLAGVELVCLSYVGPDPRSYVRYVAARLKRKDPDIRILACLFGDAAEWAAADPAALRVDAIATDLAEVERA